MEAFATSALPIVRGASWTTDGRSSRPPQRSGVAAAAGARGRDGSGGALCVCPCAPQTGLVLWPHHEPDGGRRGRFRKAMPMAARFAQGDRRRGERMVQSDHGPGLPQTGEVPRINPNPISDVVVPARLRQPGWMPAIFWLLGLASVVIALYAFARFRASAAQPISVIGYFAS